MKSVSAITAVAAMLLTAHASAAQATPDDRSQSSEPNQASPTKSAHRDQEQVRDLLKKADFIQMDVFN